MPPKKGKDKYTDPKLREEVKEELKQSDKGGAPGQWSARKAQMMASEYKKRGGDYQTDKSQQDESQKNLSKWGEEEWQTKEGSGNAKKEDGTQTRYLPKKAWENMSEEEKQETEEKKQEGSKEGKQFVGNTSKAKRERKKANEEEDEKYEGKKGKKQKEENDEGGEDEADDDEADDDDAGKGDNGAEKQEDEDDQGEQKANTGSKRKQPARSTNASKKQKSTKEGNTGNAPPGKVGSKHMDAKEPGQRGSADRLPKKGASVTWKAMPGYVDGTLEEVLTKQKSVNGKTVKASKEDPRLVLKSNSSGKICVHKPDACFYD